MAAKKMARLLPAVALAFLSMSGVATSATTQPAPPSPGVAAPGLVEEYRAVRSDKQITEEARVRATVDIYFRLKYESILQLQAFDPGFLINTATESGLDLYNYELGRFEYSVMAWRLNKLSIRKYVYSPEYASIKVEDTKARVEVCPWAEIWSGLTCRTGAETHVINLVLKGEGWKLVDDSYTDEFTEYYPRGTDFSKEIAGLGNAQPDAPPVEPPLTVQPPAKEFPLVGVALGAAGVGAATVLWALFLRRRRTGL